MGKYQFADKIINRVYDSDVSQKIVTNICYEALFHGFAGIEVFPNMVELCRKILKNDSVKIFTVITYPHGIFLPEQKAVEIKDAISLGANGVEVCINCLNVRSEEWGLVREEMKQAREAAKGENLNFIFEIEYLTDEQISRCCKIALEEKVDGIVTSTGLYNTVDENKIDVPLYIIEDDVKKIKNIVGGNIKITAQGYVDSREKADRLIKAGADFLGIENINPFIYS
jgi:deoxyribose-phosphate aldolase